MAHFILFSSISYFFEDQRGLFPEVQFVYDLEVPRDFKPECNDGEVEAFYCWTIAEVRFGTGYNYNENVFWTE